MKMRTAGLKCSLRFVSCLLLLALQGFSTTSPPSSKSGLKKPATNVILITIDTVRADHLGCYGAKEIQTPTLDALAHDGILFERAISQVPLTWPSHAAILTGLYPFQNGVQDFTGQPLEARFRSITQAFHDHGYATGAVVSSFVLDRSWGLARGFDFSMTPFLPKSSPTKNWVWSNVAPAIVSLAPWLGYRKTRAVHFSSGYIYTILTVLTIPQSHIERNIKAIPTTERSPMPTTNSGA